MTTTEQLMKADDLARAALQRLVEDLRQLRDEEAREIEGPALAKLRDMAAERLAAMG